MTRHRESEASSSSLYNQNNPWEPAVSFESFIRDDESIEDQVMRGEGCRGGRRGPGTTCCADGCCLSVQDLVAWVTVGFLHVPHAEDIPNTATPGNSVGFFLRPFNFFDEDPSMASRGAIIVRPQDPDFTRLEVQRWTPDSAGPCVAPEPFSYNGTYWPV